MAKARLKLATIINVSQLTKPMIYSRIFGSDCVMSSFSIVACLLSFTVAKKAGRPKKNSSQ